MQGATKERSIKLPSIPELDAEIRARIVNTRYFKIGRIDEMGQVIGFGEYPKGKVPTDHQAFHYDAQGRVIYFEKHSREFSRPSKRYYRYENDQLSDSIWVDRYGRFDNYHRYVFDELSGLMLWRAEYNPDGSLFYSIKSEYDYKAQAIEESWWDAKNRLIRRFEYTYDERGEVATQKLYDSGNKFKGFHKFKHDAKGNLIERRWHSPDGTPRGGYIYTLGPMDRVIKIQAVSDKGTMNVRKEFEHDAIGNVVRERWFDHQNALIKDLRF